MIPRLQAEEMLLWAHTWMIAGQAANMVVATSREAITAARDSYEAFTTQLKAQAELVEVGAGPQAGVQVLHSADDLRDWFWTQGGIRI